ncbi:hypothetical protein AOLI_G00090780 [Acnodon oligacanthus]
MSREKTWRSASVIASRLGGFLGGCRLCREALNDATPPGGRVGSRGVFGVQSLSGGAARRSSVPASGPQRDVNTEPRTRRSAVLIQRVLC